MTISVITVPVVDGGTYYIALAAKDAAAVRRDRTMIDAVVAEACLEVDRNGRAEWQWPIRCKDSARGREAIRRYRERDDEIDPESQP